MPTFKLPRRCLARNTAKSLELNDNFLLTTLFIKYRLPDRDIALQEVTNERGKTEPLERIFLNKYRHTLD